MRTAFVAGVSALCLGMLCACTSARVWTLGKQATPREPFCEVAMEPSIPQAPREDLAWVEMRCLTPVLASTECMIRLWERTCALGGDLVYAISEEAIDPREPERIIRAIIARRVLPGSVGLRPPDESLPEQKSVKACKPSCKPGYRCVADACVPQCAPACAAGWRCSDDRVCRVGS